jgi:hypothetical protein
MVRVVEGPRATPGRPLPSHAGRVPSSVPVGGARKGLTGRPGSARSAGDPKGGNSKGNG